MSVGCHIAIGDNPKKSKGQQIIDALLKLPDLGANALQIFVSPRHGASSGKPINENDAKEIKDLLKGSRTFLVIHAKYDLNFCDPNVNWYRTALEADLRKANQIGSDIGVVIHQGKNVAKLGLSHDEAVNNYVKNIQTVLDNTSELSNPIFLENSCQQGTELGYNLQELAKIWNKFDKKYLNRLGFCLDTCHVFVAGALQMKDAEEVDDFFAEFDKLLGLKNLRVIHFNDSKTPFDGHNDFHHDIGAGFVTNPDYQSTMKKYQQVGPGGRGTEVGLRRIAAWAKKLDIPCILETPREAVPIKDQLDLVNSWMEQEEEPKEKKKINFKKPLAIIENKQQLKNKIKLKLEKIDK